MKLKSKEYNAMVEALKKTNECHWNGTTYHENIEYCLNGINIFLGINSGLYNPRCIRIKGLKGYYMVNENDTLCFEARIIKVSENKFNIQYLSNSEYDKLINNYNIIFTSKN